MTAEVCVGAVIGGACQPSRVEFTDSAVLPLVVTPTAAGRRSWDVTVRSNEFGAPARTLRVTALGVDVSACQLVTQPQELRVPVSPGFPSVNRLQLRTQGAPCVVAGVTSSDARVRVDPNGVIFPRVLEAGESLADLSDLGPASVRVAVPGSPRPLVEVPLTFVPSNLLPCVRAVPEMVDVGEASNGCRAPERSVTLRKALGG